MEMQRSTGFFRCIAMVALCSPVAVTYGATAESSAVEEVLVTGSYIKRSTEDSPSPMAVVDKATIDEIGALDVKDVVNTLTYNAGNISRSSAFYGGDNSTGGTSVNLRNLGVGSTLVLINGKRTIQTLNDSGGNSYVNLSHIVPNIAISRVEVVKDGASALYGSDAIAGVVNFITREDFEGFEMSVDRATDDETKKQDDTLVQAIMGVSSDRGNITISASHLDRDPLFIGNRFDDYGRTGISSFGQPGRYQALGPLIDPTTGTGLRPDGTPVDFDPTARTSSNDADLDCNVLADPNGMGNLGEVTPGICVYDFSSFFALVGREEQTKAFVTGNYNMTDTVEIYGGASFSDNFFQRNNSLFPDVALATLPADHPALVKDAARRNIVPVPYLASQRMLGGNLFTPLSERPVDTRDSYESQIMRLSLGMRSDFQFGNNTWTLDISAAQSNYDSKFSLPSDTIASHTDAAYNGLGGPICDGNRGSAYARLNGLPFTGNGECYFYNPFGSSRVLPNGSAQTDESLRNPDSLLKWMAGEIAGQTTSEQKIFDLVFAGDIGEFNDMPIGLAVGLQYMNDEIDVDADKVANDFDYKFVLGGPDWGGELTTTAAFAELSFPILSNMELNVAGRYQDFDELDDDTFDPKVTLLWQPTDTLSLRASGGTSYRVGSLLQLFGSSTELINTVDPFSGQATPVFLPSITAGNTNLSPETAEVYNFGFSWRPTSILEGFSVDADYYYYKYEDILSRNSSTGLVSADNLSRCPNGYNSNPNAGPLCGIQPDGTVESIGPGLSNVIRTEAGYLTSVFPTYFNASSLDVSGIDMTLGYEFDTTGLGLFRFGVTGSYAMEYDLTLPGGVKVDGIGSRNSLNSIGRAMPEFKINGTIGWLYDRHAININAYWIDEYRDDGAQNALRAALSTGLQPDIDSMLTVDAQYSFQMPSFGFQAEGSALTLGVRNIANETPPKVNVDGGYDPFAHDPRGRIFYFRYLLAL